MGVLEGAAGSPEGASRAVGAATGAVEAAAGGRPAFGRGYGMANLDLGIATTPTSIVRTESVSKRFTAAVVVLLAREGVFSLDDPAPTYLPELPALYQVITLRNLLHHKSGIRDYLELMEMKGVGRGALEIPGGPPPEPEGPRGQAPQL